MRLHAAHLVLALDLIGTALFAAEGATTAVHAHLDLLGILVLGFVTSLGGGIVRDLLIGATPPASIRDWRYAAISFATAACIFVVPHASNLETFSSVVTVLDAAGLAFFAVAGATKALEFGMHPLLATLMGGITGVGGGTVRDMLLAQVPKVLRSDIYAAAALLGAAVTVFSIRFKINPTIANVLGIAACFTTRMLAVHFSWNLPHAA